ncbi:MAG: hypothetical protein CMF98_05515 [Candidatus Marinimicrobia bacterium]|nr:hypothetical protein [Candidatus Neomarinimicrobiota bacterium]OUW50113.1 MAG: hypothetical protein CBD50_04050 [bacterium TMED190]
MLSRVANNLFWMDRYMERSFGLLNLINTNYNSALESGDYSSWIDILNKYLNISENFSTPDNYDDTISIIDYILFDDTNPNTLLNTITHSRENARNVQEHISRDIWLSTNKYYLYISKKTNRTKFKKSNPIEFLEDLKKFNMIYLSSAYVSQERGSAYCFMNLGKYLERTIFSIDILTFKILELSENNQSLIESLFLKNLIFLMGGYQLYVKTYKSIFNIENIIEMIIINEFFPRSVKYNLNRITQNIIELDQYNQIIGENELVFNAKKLQNTLTYTTINSIKEIGLNSFLLELKNDLNNLSQLINQRYFSQL